MLHTMVARTNFSPALAIPGMIEMAARRAFSFIPYPPLANITGLPLCHAYLALRRVGIVSGARPEGECQRHFDFVCPVWRGAQRQGRALFDGAEYESWRDDIAGRRPRGPSIP